jgi:hypothetical protein
MFWRGKVFISIPFFINKNCKREESMKKLILALSIVGILGLGIVPAQALVGMPDAVPGTHLIQPFFLVPIPGTDGTDNTLMAMTEVRGFGGTEIGSPCNGKLHWTIYNRHSKKLVDGKVPYTKYDVVVLNAADLIYNNCSVDDLKALEVDLNEDGVNEYYMGYITYMNTICCEDNFIGHMYVVDMPTGRASGAILPAREYAPRCDDPCDSKCYWPQQNACLDTHYIPPIGTLPTPNFTDYEVFTPFALAYSKCREHSDWPCRAWMMPEWFRLLPRYYLKDHTGETFFFIWTSGNWGEFFEGAGVIDPDAYSVDMLMYDEDEHCRSGWINLPYELNFVNVRHKIPTAWLDTALGGWFDIYWEISCIDTWDPDWEFPYLWDAVPLAAEWLGYSYQYAFEDSLGLNWNALFPIHRDVSHLEPICTICPSGD